jgi:hypothetical protein
VATLTAAADGDFNTNATWTGGASHPTGTANDGVTVADLNGHAITVANGATIGCSSITDSTGLGSLTFLGASATVNADINETVLATGMVQIQDGNNVTINGQVRISANSTDHNTPAIAIYMFNAGAVTTLTLNATGGRAAVSVTGAVSSTTLTDRGATCAIVADGSASAASKVVATINGDIVNTGTRAGCVGTSNSTIILNGNGINGTNGTPTAGAGGVVFFTITGGATNTGVTVSKSLINYANGGYPTINAFHAAGVHVNIAGNWESHDASNTGALNGQYFENVVIVQGNVVSAVGQKAINDQDTGGAMVVLGQIQGDVYISGCLLLSPGDAAQNDFYNDFGFWVSAGPPIIKPAYLSGRDHFSFVFYVPSFIVKSSPTSSSDSVYCRTNSVASQYLACMSAK